MTIIILKLMVLSIMYINIIIRGVRIDETRETYK